MIERDETRERFLAAIAERLDPEVIAEAHLFPPIRQGGQESGVAVLAVNHARGEPATRASDSDEGPEHDRAAPRNDGLGVNADASADDTPAARDAVDVRLTVYAAKYRLALKGLERGKWEFSMQAEADAPLVTIDEVVRGVQRRSGDEEDPIRLTGEEFRALLPPAVES